MIPYHELDHSSNVHLYAVWKRKSKTGKTAIYNVMKEKVRFSHGGIRLGEIRWYGAFRQYVFYPDNDTMWSKGCLNIINKFLKKINDRHIRKRRRNNGSK